MEEILGLDAMTAVVMTGLVMGGIELIKRMFAKDWKVVAIIVGAALIGGFAGMAMGINILQGVVFGLASSGYVTLAQNIGKDNKGY